MTITKIIDHTRHVLFAASVSVFIFMGMVTVIGAIFSVLSFFLFLFLSYKIPFHRLRLKGWHCFLCIAIMLLISFLRCREIFYALNTSSKMAIVFSFLHLDGVIFGAKAGAFIFSFLLIIFSGYSPLYCFKRDSHDDTKKLTKSGVVRVNKSSWLTAFLLLVISFVYTLCISKCGPLTNQISESDYSIFYIIGKEWSKGNLPYVGMFDHKGPLIFFIYMIGYIINESLGIYLLQILALWCTLYFAYKILEDNFKINMWADCPKTPYRGFD